MVKSNMINHACRYCVPLTVAWGVLTAHLLAADVMLNLSDFVCTVGNARLEASVKREIPACVGVTKGKDEEFKSESGPFSIIPLTLKAKKSGRLMLVPELFLVRDGGLYGVYRMCQGIRVVEPKPDARVAAFHPPSDARQWPGHAGRIAYDAGDTVVIELLFNRIVRDDAEILAAASVAALMGLNTQDVHNKAVGSYKE